MSLHYYTRGSIFHFDENLVGFFTPKVPSSLSNLSKCEANVTVAAKAKVWSQKAYMYFGCHFNVPYFDKACPPQWEQGILTLHYFRFLNNDFKKGDPAEIFWKYVMNSVGVIENPYLNQSKYLDFLQNTQQFLHFSVKFVVL